MGGINSRRSLPCPVCFTKFSGGATNACRAVCFSYARAMQKIPFAFAVFCLAVPAFAAERQFRFSGESPDKTPAGFRSVVAGEGKPGDWKIVDDEVPSAMRTLTTQAPLVSRRTVLGQLAKDPTDEHFPILMFDGDTYGDFTLTTRLKLVSGEVEQMAGVVFQIQDERNFYVIRASGLGNNIRFYKVVNGERGNLIGPDLPVRRGEWHELKIECAGNQIHAWLDGKEAIPVLT